MEQGTVLNPLDILIVAVVLVGMYIGSKRGVVKGMSRIVAILASLIGAIRLRWIAEHFYLDSLNLQLSTTTAAIVSFCTVFVIVYIVVSTILGFLTKGLEKMNVKIDNALGALLGGVISTLVLSVGLVMLGFINFPSPDNARGSVLYPHVKNFSRTALGVGVQGLRELNRAANKYGKLQANPNQQPASQQQQPGAGQPGSEKPKAIR